MTDNRTYPQPQTITEPDMDLSLLLDDAPDYVCEWVVPECSNEAVRLLHMKAASGKESDEVCRCARKVLSCLPCMERVSSPHGITACCKCGCLMEIRFAEALR